MPQYENLYVGASFKLTIPAVPLVCEWMAQDILGETLPYAMETFDPARFYRV